MNKLLIIACPEKTRFNTHLNDIKIFTQKLMKFKEYSVIELPFSKLPPSLRAITFNFHGNEFHINSYNYKESFLSGWIQIDRFGYTGWHSSNYDFVNKEINTLRNDDDLRKRISAYIKKNTSKYKQKKIQELNLPKKYILFPLQKPQDETSLFYRIQLDEALNKIYQFCIKNNFFFSYKETSILSL